MKAFKYLRTAGGCLVALLVLSGVATALAFAEEPALYECGKVTGKTGKWERGCTVEHAGGTGGEWEIRAEERVRKFGNGSKEKVLDWFVEGFGTWECKSHIEGKWTGPKTADIKLVLKNCEAEGVKFTSEGAMPGEIVFNSLKGQLGYIDREHHEVGLVLSPESGSRLVSFTWGTFLLFVVERAVIGTLSPVNEFTKTMNLKFLESFNKQEPQNLEGGLKETLISEECNNPPSCEPTGEAETAWSGEMNPVGESLMLKG